jgi:hypothetical protein
MGDGSVRFMSDATSLAELRSLLLINDGAPVTPPP